MQEAKQTSRKGIQHNITTSQQQFSQKILEDNVSEVETDGTATLNVQRIMVRCVNS